MFSLKQKKKSKKNAQAGTFKGSNVHEDGSDFAKGGRATKKIKSSNFDDGEHTKYDRPVVGAPLPLEKKGKRGNKQKKRRDAAENEPSFILDLERQLKGRKKKREKKCNSLSPQVDVKPGMKRKKRPGDEGEDEPEEKDTSGLESEDDDDEGRYYRIQRERQEAADASQAIENLYKPEYKRASTTYLRHTQLVVLEDQGALVSPMDLARRKCNDQSFYDIHLGRKCARSLVVEEDFKNACDTSEILKFLWVQTGDLRNPLMTLTHVPADRTVHLYFNDVSLVSFARNILLLSLLQSPRSDSAEHATFVAVWCDALMSENNYEQMNEVLRELVTMKTFPPWLFVTPETWIACKRHWTAWLLVSNSKDKQVLLKSARMKAVAKVTHMLKKTTPEWLEHGVASEQFEPTVHTRVNPSLYNFFPMYESKPQFLECESPAGSFASLLDPSSDGFFQALHNAWSPLLTRFQTGLQQHKVACCFKIGNGLETMKESAKRGTLFHAIDSSDLMDFVGLWNVLLSSKDALVPGTKGSGWCSFLFTEQLTSSSSTVTEMLRQDVPPYDRELGMNLASLVGFAVKPMSSSLKNPFGVHARWIRKTDVIDDTEVNTKVLEHFDQSNLDAELCISLIDVMNEILNPKPLASKVLKELSNIHENEVLLPLNEKYLWPTHTTGTFIELISSICKNPRKIEKDKVSGLLDDLFYQRDYIGGTAYVQNRSLALRIECSLRSANLEPSLDVANAYENGILFKKIRRVSIPCKPLTNLTERKEGGVEPTLVFCLIRNEKVLEKMLSTTGVLGASTPSTIEFIAEDESRKEDVANFGPTAFTDSEEDIIDDDEPVNLLYEWFGERGGYAIQFIDNLEFDPLRNKIFLNLPCNDTVPAVHSIPGASKHDDKITPPRYPPLVAFKFAVLIDVYTNEILTKPIKMKKIID